MQEMAPARLYERSEGELRTEPILYGLFVWTLECAYRYAQCNFFSYRIYFNIGILHPYCARLTAFIFTSCRLARLMRLRWYAFFPATKQQSSRSWQKVCFQRMIKCQPKITYTQSAHVVVVAHLSTTGNTSNGALTVPGAVGADRHVALRNKYMHPRTQSFPPSARFYFAHAPQCNLWPSSSHEREASATERVDESGVSGDVRVAKTTALLVGNWHPAIASQTKGLQYVGTSSFANHVN